MSMSTLDRIFDLDEGPLPPLPRPPKVEKPNPADHWHWFFKDAEKYDWNDPDFKKWNKGEHGYRIIPLTQGYFMIVCKKDYKRMTKYPDGTPMKWFAQVEYNELGEIVKVYARRRGRRLPWGKEPLGVYAHRQVKKCHFKGSDVLVDHINGYGLDNREYNLKKTDTRGNGLNSARKRKEDLPRGVQRCGEGNKFFHAKVSKRLNGVAKHYYSEQFETAELAAEWYKRKSVEIHGRRAITHMPTEKSYPEFPPRISTSVSSRELEDVPF